MDPDQPLLDPAALDLPVLTTLVADAVTAATLARFRDAGHPAVRQAHGYVFQHLVAGSPTVSELGALLGVTQQAASKMLTELEGLGYVRRARSDADGRSRRVELTVAGRKVVELGRRIRLEIEGELVDRVGPRKVEEARRTLAALLDVTGGHEVVARRRVPLPTA